MAGRQGVAVMLMILLVFGCGNGEFEERLTQLETEHRALDAQYQELEREMEELNRRGAMSMTELITDHIVAPEEPKDTTVQIEPSLWSTMFNGADVLPDTVARVLPHRGPDAEIDGVRVSGIRRDSPLEQMGVRNGDVIHSVNGADVRGEELLPNITADLKIVDLELTRRGRKMKLTIEVR